MKHNIFGRKRHCDMFPSEKLNDCPDEIAIPMCTLAFVLFIIGLWSVFHG